MTFIMVHLILPLFLTYPETLGNDYTEQDQFMKNIYCIGKVYNDILDEHEENSKGLRKKVCAYWLDSANCEVSEWMLYDYIQQRIENCMEFFAV